MLRYPAKARSTKSFSLAIVQIITISDSFLESIVNIRLIFGIGK